MVKEWLVGIESRENCFIPRQTMHFGKGKSSNHFFNTKKSTPHYALPRPALVTPSSKNLPILPEHKPTVRQSVLASTLLEMWQDEITSTDSEHRKKELCRFIHYDHTVKPHGGLKGAAPFEVLQVYFLNLLCQQGCRFLQVTHTHLCVL